MPPVALGLCLDGFIPVHEMVALAREAEAAGFTSLWMADHLGYREAVTTCAAIAVSTARLRIGPAPLNPYTRHPLIGAMALATLEELAPGRVLLVIGTGNPTVLAELGIRVIRPLRVMREYATVMRALLGGTDPVEYHGEFLTLAGARMSFAPARRLPLYMTGVQPRMLRLAGEVADGVLLSSGCAPEYVTRCQEAVHEGAARAGRSPGILDVASYIPIAVADDPAEALEACRHHLAYILRNRHHADNIRAAGVKLDQEALAVALGRHDWETASRLVTDEVVHAFAAAGRVEECQRRVQDFVAAGVQTPVLLPLGDLAARRRVLDVARGL